MSDKVDRRETDRRRPCKIGLIVRADCGRTTLTSSAQNWEPVTLLLLFACLAIGGRLFPFEQGDVPDLPIVRRRLSWR